MNTEELKQKALAATPGPWVANQETCSLGEVCSVNQGGQPWFEICSADLFHESNNANDAAYIASANPATILDLIAERDEAIAELHVIESIINGESITTDAGYDTYRRANFIRRTLEKLDRAQAEILALESKLLEES